MGQLLKKDLSEHGPVLIVLTMLATFYAWGTGLVVDKEPNHTALLAIKNWLFLGSTLVAAYVNFRVVSREYQEQTQLFLESLPLSRMQIVTAKLATSFALCLTITAIGSLVAAVTPSHAGTFSNTAIGIAFARALFFVIFNHACFFAFAFLGRYRIPLIFLLVIGSIYVDGVTDFELNRFGPFELIGPTFTTETTEPPVRALVITAFAALAFYLIGYLLALAGEGAMTALLARKMAQQEKVFVAAVLCGGLFFGAILHDANEKEAFDLNDAVEENRAGVSIKIALGRDVEQQRAFALHLLSELDQLRADLGIDRLPPLFVSTRSDFEPRLVEIGDIGKAEGILVRLRLPESPREREEVTASIVRGLLARHTHGRALLERRRWLLDGFPIWWLRRHHPGPTDDTDLVLRALYATPSPITAEDLERWMSVRDRWGECAASGLSYTALATLEQAFGRDAVLQLAKEALVAAPPKDVRAVFSEASLADVLSRHFEMTPSEMTARWNTALDGHRLRLGDALAGLPRPEGRLEIERLSQKTRRVKYRLSSEAPPLDGTVQLRYLRVGPFAAELAPWEWRTETTPASRARAGSQLREGWSVGQRIAWTFAVDVPQLGCDVISGWRRETIE